MIFTNLDYSLKILKKNTKKCMKTDISFKILCRYFEYFNQEYLKCIDIDLTDSSNTSKKFYYYLKSFRTLDVLNVKDDGTQEWYQDGKRHRIDGSAVIHADGTQEWYKDGKRHRIDGPAIICADRSQEWYRDGKLHIKKIKYLQLER